MAEPNAVRLRPKTWDMFLKGTKGTVRATAGQQIDEHRLQSQHAFGEAGGGVIHPKRSPAFRASALLV